MVLAVRGGMRRRSQDLGAVGARGPRHLGANMGLQTRVGGLRAATRLRAHGQPKGRRRGIAPSPWLLGLGTVVSDHPVPVATLMS